MGIAQHTVDHLWIIIGVLILALCSPFIGLCYLGKWLHCRIKFEEHDWQYQRRMRPGLAGCPAYDLPKECSRCSTKQKIR